MKICIPVHRLVEEANSLLSFSMKVEVIAIDTISLGVLQKSRPNNDLVHGG